LVLLFFLFVISFIGGLVSPYREDQLFYRQDDQNKQYAAVRENTELRYITENDADFPAVARAKLVLALKSDDTAFEASGVSYRYEKASDDLYLIYRDGTADSVAIATYDVVSSSTSNEQLPFGLVRSILMAQANGDSSFDFEGTTYTLDESGSVLKGSEEVAYSSRYIVQAIMGDVFLSRSFKDELLESIDAGDTNFSFTDEDGTTADYTISYDAEKGDYSILQSVATKVFDTYSSPTPEHPLGTDRNGMDMLTRLMYGGRVSLYIGFIVVIIETLIGVILGGISGYAGGWVDNLIMRIVDVFYCIPSMPIIIILGAAMDALRVDPQIRMVYLMLLLGFLGWPGIARLVRGQILSLREQEFMTAAEATGIRASHRIFKHLIPNVIPQLIVTMTMSLGSTIITEATLSFLGLGVKFPFASWGNIINDVNDTYVLTNYWFIWIPAGICLLATVLAFNLVGDGLRDAFDPKMKR
ncbi:MAG: ABC transporter permease, partial [Atopobiaceae bacterium]|nr:ABC transporter permease [Atopobiaceae bacterium]